VFTTRLFGCGQLEAFSFQQRFIELRKAELVGFDVTASADNIRLIAIAKLLDFSEQVSTSEHLNSKWWA
jgi:hypothetical protein